jgi:acetyl esterase/lipase
MPMPARQEETVPLDSAPFALIRLLLRPGTSYGERRDALAPFDRLTDRDDEMRDEVVSLARMAVEAGIPVSVLVNNKAEGCAPLTIRALAEMLGGISDRVASKTR